ncbi:MAG: hypothetical protein U1F65_04870 [Verrucomicrobiota bacterium]
MAFATAKLTALPAFPGAEGFGANALGGRGRNVFHVTTTNDNGSTSLAGSLRQGVSVANRTIVFDVSGTIKLASDLKITVSNLTIAGQTAPGDGICLQGRTLSVQNTHDVVVRYLRCRPGNINCGSFEGDAFDFVNATNVIADHVTATWSIDECLSPTYSTNVTIQWCLIAESLRNSCHTKGQHGYGSLIKYGNGALTLHHNLYAHNSSRNPRPGNSVRLDFVNNIVYDWGFFAGYNADDSAESLGVGGLYFTNSLNYVSNYFIAGPSTTSHQTIAFDSGVTNPLQCLIYQSGNFIDGDRDLLLDGSDTGWGMFTTPYTILPGPFTAPPVTMDSPQVACERVLAFAGASHVRDAADQRVVRNARSHGGTIIDFIQSGYFTGDYVTNRLPYTFTTNTTTGVITTNYYNYIGVNPWPVLNAVTAPTDTDQDGIPNYFELAVGWSQSVSNSSHFNADGYTDLEWYLNWLAGPHVLCNRNGYLDVNLRNIVNVTNNFTFGVGAAGNGLVSLLGDQATARFVAASNTNGLATFNFYATNTVTGVGFGPVTVNVLITTTNAPNTAAPTLVAISNRTLTAGATLTFTNSAADADFPPQTLTYSLLNAPLGAGINPSNGIFTWRPAISFSGSSNFLKAVVSDNGSPSLSATQAFAVLVTSPALPQLQGSAWSNGLFHLSVTGDAGPDYVVQASTNLFSWSALYTNPSPSLPFLWTDGGATNFSRRFYRIQLGP